MKPLHIIIAVIALVIVGGILFLSSQEREFAPMEVVLEEGAGMYADYTPDLLSRAENGAVVLFFQAAWCPSCRALDADIRANAKSIPENVTILRVDYDTETDLKRAYGVTTQHTMVQVDETGALINKWSGGNTLSALVNQVQ